MMSCRRVENLLACGLGSDILIDSIIDGKTKGAMMKDKIHPEYKEVTVTCACGASFKTRSAIGKDTMQADLCSSCHPFYTGKQKFVDTAGRVEKFNRKFGGEYFKKADDKKTKK